MAEEFKYRIGDSVWAKMKGFSAWPGKVQLPPDNLKRPVMKKQMHCIFFFGTHDHAWIPEPDLKPYAEFKDKCLSGKKQSASLKKAIAEVEDYIATGNDPSKLAMMTEAEAEMDADFDALVSGDAAKSSAKKPKTPSSRKRSLSSASNDTSTAKTPKTPKVNNTDNNGSSSPVFNSTSATKKRESAVSNFLDRPMLKTPPKETAAVDIMTQSQALKEKRIEASKLSFGFLGLGIMGSGIVKNLLNSGHKVTVWNRTSQKATDFAKLGAKDVMTPADVIAEADITFSCVSDPQAVKELVFGNCGVLSEINTTKGYVEMTGIDADTSKDIAEAIALRGGRYLEAQIQGSKEEANEGTLVVLIAGDRSLFDDAQSCFQAMGKNSFYLGEVGNASQMNLVLQLMSGVALTGLAEGMALADRAGLQQKDLLEVLQLTGLSCPLMVEKGKSIIEGGFPPNQPLQHMQKDLKLSLNMGDQLEQPLPLTATANEVFKHAKRLGYGEHDTSAVYIRARF